MVNFDKLFSSNGIQLCVKLLFFWSYDLSRMLYVHCVAMMSLQCLCIVTKCGAQPGIVDSSQRTHRDAVLLYDSYNMSVCYTTQFMRTIPVVDFGQSYQYKQGTCSSVSCMVIFVTVPISGKFRRPK